MIKNWDFHGMEMDFSSMYEGNNHPSDIDMFYLCKDGTLILGEIKNDRGTFTDGQRGLLAKVINMHSADGIGLYIVHDKFYQKGDRRVDISRCQVKEIYAKQEHRWRQPDRIITVGEILDYYKQRGGEHCEV